MLGLVFNLLSAKPGCPTLSHPSAAGGTAETLAATTLVPSVSPVSPNNYRWEENVNEEYAQRVLARISHRIECIRAANQRKSLCRKHFSPNRGAPRCRQSVFRICLDLNLCEGREVVAAF